MNISRNSYLNQLAAGQGNGLIKIVTGIRRCGKSYLLFKLFHDYLISKGVKEDYIVKVALDDLMNEELREPHALLRHIRERIQDEGTYYVLLDEIQLVPNFHEVLNSLLHVRNADVYVTGSNSKFLSKDVVTEFRGRGDEIHLFPLSFSEFMQGYQGDKWNGWREYYTFGGLPLILSLETEQKKSEYLKNLYESVYLVDILERNKVRNKAEFDELTRIIASSIGSPCNPTKLSNTFKSVKNVTVSSASIARYLSYMEYAFLIEKSVRYNIKGKKYINTLSKYYFSDLGIRNALLGFRQQEESHIMENIIYNELRVRGYHVDVGMVEERTTDRNNKTIRKQYEVDFVANQGNRRYYIQSAFAMPDEAKIRQETASLTRIDDSFKKIIVVKDDIMPKRDDNGIVTIGIMDFLLRPDSLDY
ncbi:ATP-binding protein [Marseilla massiliensis]|uniref:ATP-binding protein n=1 Tax=Marseilla massiliensis TaxID=1841864 RepID=UPI0030C8948E